MSVAQRQDVFYAQACVQTGFTLNTNQTNPGRVQRDPMPTPEQITITARDLRAANQTTQTVSPTEEIMIARATNVILLVWREDGTPQQASIRDGEILPD